ncbi:MAG: type 1 glutamine amidotransferase [Zetaproteobacteria bacterium]|nr:MAG: type 1 glutamine amidotransferase [Zetaproteobacteria bacterium]
MSRRPILLLQQVAHEPAALIDERLQAAGFRCVTHLLSRQPPPATCGDYAGIVIMGGPASARDDTPAIRGQLALLTQAIAQGVPLFGVCLGAQLSAKAAGGAIILAEQRELGWYPLNPAEAAADDPLFMHLQPKTMVFQWHGESFTLPEQAVLLARGEAVARQAFRLGRGQYGLQFHLEIDAALIETWIDHGENERAWLGAEGIARVRRESPTYLPAAHALCRRLVDGWAALL